MPPAKYQPNWPGGSGEAVVKMVFTIYGHSVQLAFRIMTFFLNLVLPSYKC